MQATQMFELYSYVQVCVHNVLVYMYIITYERNDSYTMNSSYVAKNMHTPIFLIQQTIVIQRQLGKVHVHVCIS